MLQVIWSCWLVVFIWDYNKKSYQKKKRNEKQSANSLIKELEDSSNQRDNDRSWQPNLQVHLAKVEICGHKMEELEGLCRSWYKGRWGLRKEAYWMINHGSHINSKSKKRTKLRWEKCKTWISNLSTLQSRHKAE